LNSGASCAVVLFTGDLRVHDNPALAAAVAECELVIPAFVLDEHLLGAAGTSANRLTFLLDCLRDLDESLRARGARLVLRRGEPVAETVKLARRFKACSIHIGEDCTPYARERHERLARACESERIALHGHQGASIVAPVVADADRRQPLPGLHPLLADVARPAAAARRADAAPAACPRQPAGAEDSGAALADWIEALA
jgi:deoxyribodipyrimidine photolyase